jgi:GNAT superfamily N-acetyltransferase
MNADKLKLTYIHFSAFHGGKTFRMLDFLAEKMEKECGFPPGYIARAMTTAKKGDKDAVRDNGFFILHDDKNLYCASVMNKMAIQTRWVPPKHRGKGYATLMLRKIEEMVQAVPHEHLALWIVSYRRMDGLNTRAGWLRSDVPGRDRHTGELPAREEDYQFDWFPPWAETAYRNACLSSKGQLPGWSKGYWRDYYNFVETYGGRKELDLRYT